MKLRRTVAAVLCSAIILAGCNSEATKKDTDETAKSDFSRADVKEIKAQDDFYGYINLNTLKELSIGPGEGGAGPMYDDGVEEALKAKIKEIVTGNEKYEKGSCEDIILRAYNSFIEYESDEENKKRSAEIIEADIKKIMDCKTIDELTSISPELAKKYYISPLGSFTVQADTFDPDKYCIMWAQNKSVLGLDLKEVSDDSSNAEDGEMIVIDCLMAAGVDHDTAEDTAHDLMYLVIDIALASDKDMLLGMKDDAIRFVSEEEINEFLTYHTAKEVESWIGIESNPYGGWMIEDEGQIKSIEKLYTDENLECLKAWYVTELVTTYGSFIVDDYPEIGKYFPVSGLDIDTRAYYFIDQKYTMALSDLYIKYFYTDEMEEKLMTMCDDIVEGYRVLIRNTDWLSGEAKEGLEKKLDNITFLTGKTVLDNMENDTDLADTFKGSLAETLIASNELSFNEFLGNIGTVRDRNEIRMKMQLVNACYSQDNTVTITAAIMNDPWFNVNNSYYVNLGGLGAVIAHEIGHGFDSNLIKYNENGVLDPDWLSSEDMKKLEERNLIAVDYFESFKVFEIYAVDGEQTLGENYADLGGMEAVMTTCEIKNATNDDYKTVFESYGKLWCVLLSDSGIIDQLAFDTHSPSTIRVNAILSTTEKFYEVYDIKEGDGMYVAPENRIGRWK